MELFQTSSIDIEDKSNITVWITHKTIEHNTPHAKATFDNIFYTSHMIGRFSLFHGKKNIQEKLDLMSFVIGQYNVFFFGIFLAGTNGQSSFFLVFSSHRSSSAGVDYSTLMTSKEFPA